mmetsp:Transcript_6924/g.21059  ORF Transcript_6924/g.21059 Transcript_6924/m.21059 type:complete len:203 (+) Transcript_6924:1777-2385(+)
MRMMYPLATRAVRRRPLLHASVHAGTDPTSPAVHGRCPGGTSARAKSRGRAVVQELWLRPVEQLRSQAPHRACQERRPYLWASFVTCASASRWAYSRRRQQQRGITTVIIKLGRRLSRALSASSDLFLVCRSRSLVHLCRKRGEGGEVQRNTCHTLSRDAIFPVRELEISSMSSKKGPPAAESRSYCQLALGVFHLAAVSAV